MLVEDKLVRLLQDELDGRGQEFSQKRLNDSMWGKRATVAPMRHFGRQGNSTLGDFKGELIKHNIEFIQN